MIIDILDGEFRGDNDILLTRYRGYNQEKRRYEGFLIFGHPILAKELTKQRLIAGDGIHQVAPPPFQQLYIIGFFANHVRGGIKFFPCVYILMTNKTQFLYEKLFGWLASQGDDSYLKWVTYISDFEFGAINAVINNVPRDRPNLENLEPHGI